MIVNLAGTMGGERERARERGRERGEGEGEREREREREREIQSTSFFSPQATMFGIPMYPWFVWGVIVAFTFTALILFQTNVYNFTRYL